MRTGRDVIVIAGSEGGLHALCRVVTHLPADFPATILAAIGTPQGEDAETLAVVAEHTSLPASWSRHDEEPLPGHVYLAPPDRHLVVLPSGRLGLDAGPKVCNVRPAADPLFKTAAAVFGRRVVAVILSGSDHNGVEGMQFVHRAGGVCIVQSPADAAVPEMLINALLIDHTDHCVLLDRIPRLLVSLAMPAD